MKIMPKKIGFLFIGMFSSVVNATTAEPIQVGKNVSANMDVLGVLTSLLIVLGLIVVSAWVLKRFNFTQTQMKGMKVVSSLALGPKERLYVVDISNQQYLLGVTTQQITLIEKLEQPLPSNTSSKHELPSSIASLIKKSS